MKTDDSHDYDMDPRVIELTKKLQQSFNSPGMDKLINIHLPNDGEEFSKISKTGLKTLRSNKNAFKVVL